MLTMVARVVAVTLTAIVWAAVVEDPAPGVAITASKVLAAVPLGADEFVQLSAVADGFILGTNTSDKRARLRYFSNTGKLVWDDQGTTELYSFSVSKARLMTSTHAEQGFQTKVIAVRNIRDGQVVTKTSVPLEKEVEMSVDGSALALLMDPTSDMSRDLEVRSIAGERSRSFKTDESVGAAAAIDYEHVFLLTVGGRVDSYVGRTRTWSARAGTDYLDRGLRVFPESGFVIAQVPIGAFVILDFKTGEELFRSSRDLSQVVASIRQENLTQAVPRFRPVMAVGGHVLLQDRTGTLESLIDLDPRTRTGIPSPLSLSIREALTAFGIRPDQQRPAPVGRGDCPTLAVNEALDRAAVRLEDRIIFIALDR